MLACDFLVLSMVPWGRIALDFGVRPKASEYLILSINGCVRFWKLFCLDLSFHIYKMEQVI